MLTIKWDSQYQFTQPSGDREEIAYLRGTVVNEALDGLVAAGTRVRVFDDGSLPKESSWTEVTADFRDITSTKPGEGTTHVGYTLMNVAILRVLTPEETKPLASALAIANLRALQARGPRSVDARPRVTAAAEKAVLTTSDAF